MRRRRKRLAKKPSTAPSQDADAWRGRRSSAMAFHSIGADGIALSTRTLTLLRKRETCGGGGVVYWPMTMPSSTTTPYTRIQSAARGDVRIERCHLRSSAISSVFRPSHISNDALTTVVLGRKGGRLFAAMATLHSLYPPGALDPNVQGHSSCHRLFLLTGCRRYASSPTLTFTQDVEVGTSASIGLYGRALLRLDDDLRCGANFVPMLTLRTAAAWRSNLISRERLRSRRTTNGSADNGQAAPHMDGPNGSPDTVLATEPVGHGHHIEVKERGDRAVQPQTVSTAHRRIRQGYGDLFWLPDALQRNPGNALDEAAGSGEEGGDPRKRPEVTEGGCCGAHRLRERIGVAGRVAHQTTPFCPLCPPSGLGLQPTGLSKSAI